MREKWALLIVLATAVAVLLLAAQFARMQNPPGETRQADLPAPAAPRPAGKLNAEAIEAGYRVYRQQNCARCHAAAGKGNPRYPLDGVGARRSAAELRQWVTGAGNLQGQLPARAYKSKQAYRELAEDELDLLVVYLQGL